MAENFVNSAGKRRRNLRRTVDFLQTFALLLYSSSAFCMLNLVWFLVDPIDIIVSKFKIYIDFNSFSNSIAFYSRNPKKIECNILSSYPS